MSAHSPEDRQIHDLWRRLEQAWAAGSGDAFAAVFAEDAEFVSIRGEEQHGRAEIAARHGALFTSAYRGSSLSAEVRKVRYLTPEIALVHATSTVTPQGAPAGMNTHAQAVVERRDGAWRIVAFHNMVPFTPPPPR